MPKLILPADIENLEKLLRFVSEQAAETGFSEKRVNEIELATEEALVNIVHYAYPEGQAGDVEVACIMNDDGGFMVRMTDAGIPFNPKNLEDPDVGADITSRQIGGLGVFLIRKMVDEWDYQRDGDKNILTFVIMERDRDNAPQKG
jgi:sigma-B regulation protein RsbU (phosphoserine phosphatase)